MERFNADEHVARGHRDSGLIKIIARPDLHNEYAFIIPRNILCLSPVLKDYLDYPDTIPPEVGRSGEGTLTFNTGKDVMRAVLEYMRKEHGRNDCIGHLKDRSAVFFIQLYKMAICFGLDHLCATTLDSIRSSTLEIKDFLSATLEAFRLRIIEDRVFRRWFVAYIRRRQDDMLKVLNVDNDHARLCCMLVLTLAHVEGGDDVKQDGVVKSEEDVRGHSDASKQPRTPTFTPSEDPSDMFAKFHKEFDNISPLSGRAPGSSTKKRKMNATVEDAPDD